MAVESPAPKSSVNRTAHDPRVKETVESILVAFILAFIFRGFVVEAFVIPTGSLAPTLYGAHMRMQCPDCGFTWDIGYSTPGSDDNIKGTASLDMSYGPYHCPNCGYAISSEEEHHVRFGDRILVLKYQYLFSGPNRWDVVVFKSPSEMKDSLDPDYSVNYIKRLAGLPGESVVILDGSVYTADGRVDLRFGPNNVTVVNADQFRIQRRPGYAQDRLWRVIDNNDFLPHMDRSTDPAQNTWHEPWVAGAGPHPWHTSDAAGRPLRSFTLAAPTGSPAQALTFNGEANPDTYALTNWLAYDEFEHRRNRDRQLYVSDLKLSCSYTRHSGDGALLMQLTKRDDVFTARITPGKVALLHGKMLQQQPLQVGANRLVAGTEVAAADLAGSGPVQIELQNVDYRVSLIVNGKTLIQTTDAEYHPDVAALFTDYKNGVSPPMPTVQIAGENQNCSVQHLTLSRNIYYVNRGDRTFWGSPERIVHLNPGEYFVLGDNSSISADARYWNDPVKLPSEGIPFVESGRVPAEFMLGKAFFVYWPAGYAPAKTSLNIAPDFGEMRFIH